MIYLDNRDVNNVVLHLNLQETQQLAPALESTEAFL